MEGSQALILGDTKKLSKQDQQYFDTLFFNICLFVQLCHVSVVHTGPSLWDVESFHCVWAPEIQGQGVVKLRFNCM